MHGDQDTSLFIYFSSYPFGGIVDTLPLLRFRFHFFCLFTDNQPQIYLSVRELFFFKNVFQYALILNKFKKGKSPRSKALLVGSNVSPRDSINLNSPPFYTSQLSRFCNKAMFRLCPAWSFTALQLLNHLYRYWQDVSSHMYWYRCNIG